MPELNQEFIDALSLDKGKTDQIWFDDKLLGFGVRLRAGGKRTWVVQYRIGALQKRLTIGNVEAVKLTDARAKAKTELAKVTLGGDPQAKKAEERAKAQHTLGAVAKQYLEHQQPKLKPKTHSEAKHYLEHHWKALRDIPLHNITRLDVATRVSEIKVKSGPSAAGHARLALSALYAWAIGEGITDSNPVIGSNAPVTRSRDRVLSNDELAEIWHACADDDYGKIVRLLMLTGQRRGEVAGMRWSELDLDAAVWRLPAARTKNGLPHEVPLAATALAIIKKVRRDDERDLLFGRGPSGLGGWGKPKLDLDAAISTARKKAGVKKPMPEYVLHDLRRSVATGLGNLGILPHVIEAALNHISGAKKGVAGTYNKSAYAREVRAAMLTWDDHVKAIVGGGERKIVPFPQAALDIA